MTVLDSGTFRKHYQRFAGSTRLLRARGRADVLTSDVLGTSPRVNKNVCDHNLTFQGSEQKTVTIELVPNRHDLMSYFGFLADSTVLIPYQASQ